MNYSGNFQSTLEVFDVSVGAGFTKLDSVDHTALVMSCYIEQNGGVPPGGYYDPYYCGAPEVRRGMFVTGNEEPGAASARVPRCAQHPSRWAIR